MGSQLAASRKKLHFAPPNRNHTKLTKISIFGEKDEHSAVPKALRHISFLMCHSKIVPSFLRNFVLVNIDHKFCSAMQLGIHGCRQGSARIPENIVTAAYWLL